MVYSIMRDFTLIVLMCVLTNEFTLIEIILFLSCYGPLYPLFFLNFDLLNFCASFLTKLIILMAIVILLVYSL